MNFMNLLGQTNPKDILKYLPDAVLVVNEKSGKIVWANDRALNIFELSNSDIKITNFNDLVNKGVELADQSSRKDVPVIGGSSVNNKEFFVELNATLLDDEFIISLRDVTAMTNVLVNAEKTGRLNKDKNTMLSKISNDFTSPVQSIIGFSQALKDGLGGEINSKQEKYVRIINKNAQDLLYYMGKFFEFSKAESGLSKLDYQVFDVVNTIQNIVKNNEDKISAKNLTVNISSDKLTTKTVFSDEESVKTIMQNLLETSIKLTEIGSINIEISDVNLELVENAGIKLIKDAKETSYIAISVTDNGIGFQGNEIDGIFEPYTQIDKKNKKNLVRAFCLGTAKEIVQRLHGAIWLNTEVMKGTIFNIILPVEKGAVQQDE